MILCDVVLYDSPVRKNIFIAHGRIKKIADATDADINNTGKSIFNLSSLRAFPGFINSHDHLDFNNYPRLGNGCYQNYTEWGPDIQIRFANEIIAVKKIPQPLRIQWGLYKNLLNGFTTVVNHGEKIKVGNELIYVFQDCYSLHSVSFEKNWWWRLNHPFRNDKPFVMHLGEGVDEPALQEIQKVVKYNWLKKEIIAVHGVAMKKPEAKSFRGLVWCPASNYFLLQSTAAINELKESTNILFGTDSTLTSPWRIQEHFRYALKSGIVTEKELVSMLTDLPSRCWKLHGRGVLAEGATADIVITTTTGLGDIEIMMVLKEGEVLLADETIIKNNEAVFRDNYTRIRLGRQVLYVKGNLSELVNNITRYYPAAEIPFELL